MLEYEEYEFVEASERPNAKMSKGPVVLLAIILFAVCAFIVWIGVTESNRLRKEAEETTQGLLPSASKAPRCCILASQLRCHNT